MFSKIWIAVAVFLLTPASLWAQEEGQIWFVSYAIEIVFLALTLLVLFRPTQRRDSALSLDELQELKAEEKRKAKGIH